MKDGIHVVKFGSKYFKFYFKNEKLFHLEESRNDNDFRFKLFNNNKNISNIVKTCPSNEEHKKIVFLSLLNKWCEDQWKISEIPISLMPMFEKTCKQMQRITGLANNIAGNVKDECILLGCYKGLNAPVQRDSESIIINETIGRNALNDKWKDICRNTSFNQKKCSVS